MLEGENRCIIEEMNGRELSNDEYRVAHVLIANSWSVQNKHSMRIKIELGPVFLNKFNRIQERYEDGYYLLYAYDEVEGDYTYYHWIYSAAVIPPLHSRVEF